jgi:hypothetical protein
MVGGLRRSRVGSGGRAIVGFQQALALEAKRREDLVVPVDITARPVFLLDELGLQAHRFIGLRIELRIYSEAGALAEVGQDLVGELLVLGAVEDDPLGSGTAARSQGEKQEEAAKPGEAAAERT